MTFLRKISCRTHLVFAAALAAVALVSPALAADDLDKILAKLDGSAKNFTSAQADIVWDNIQTQPIPDKDSQVGTVLFARGKDGQMQVAVHIKSDNGKPMQKDISYAGGVGKMYEPAIKQIQVFKVGDKSSQLETFLTLGFGGSGQDLKKNWEITPAGSEAVNGTQAAKLQLVPHDPTLAKTTPKVLLWIDLDKGVALKQQRFDSTGNYVIFTYSNVQLNKKVSSNAFEIKTASGTQVVNH